MFPNTLVLPLAKTTSDHLPCKVQIQTTIPRADIFRFENYWPLQNGFQEIMHDSWLRDSSGLDSARSFTSKLKHLRYNVKKNGTGIGHP